MKISQTQTSICTKILTHFFYKLEDGKKKVKMHPPPLGHSFLLIVTWIYHMGSICFTTRHYIEHLAYLILLFFQGLICATKVQVCSHTR